MRDITFEKLWEYFHIKAVSPIISYFAENVKVKNFYDGYSLTVFITNRDWSEKQLSFYLKRDECLNLKKFLEELFPNAIVCFEEDDD